MSLPSIGRRRFLLVGATGVAAGLAGCSGDGSMDEIETDVEASVDHVEAAQQKLPETAGNVQEQEWTACLEGVDGIRSDLDAARQSSTDALELAREGGHTDHVTAMERMQEYLDVFEELVDELELACESGEEGNDGEVEQHWNTVQQLDEDRKAKREEVSAAIDELR